MDLITYALCKKNGGESITYTLTADTENKTIVLTPSEGTAQVITVPYATDASTVNGHEVPELENGKIPANFLPSFVDNVDEYDNISLFPVVGESNRIYIDKSTNKTYRWSGTAYVEISESIALGETSSTAYRGDRGKIAYDHSQSAHAPSNAEANQNAFSNVKIDSDIINASAKTDTLEFIAGDNIILTPNVSNKKITVSQVPVRKIASGDIASFSDGTGDPFLEVKASIEPVQSGSGDPSPQNVRPISGWSGANVTNMDNISDKAFFDGLLNGTYGVVDLGSLSWIRGNTGVTGRYRFTTQSLRSTAIATLSSVVADLKTSIFITVKGDTGWTSDVDNVVWCDIYKDINVVDSLYTDVTAFKNAMDGVHLIYKLATPTTPTITPSELNALYAEFGINGSTLSIPFHDSNDNPITVYGGRLNVTSGELTVTMASVDLGTLNWEIGYGAFVATITNPAPAYNDVPANMLCTKYPIKAYNAQSDKSISRIANTNIIRFRDSDYESAAAAKTALNGVQLVYELATPQTYQLTPAQVTTLLNQNNIFADCGQIEVAYKTPFYTDLTTKNEVQVLINESITSALNASY